jgi:hypothetical protein
MFELITHPGDGPAFSVAINGQAKSYPSDKEGKRQAILDGLAAIPPVTAGNDTYLPSNQALQIVAAVMYPAGIATEEAYEKVSLATTKACALIGYGEEVQLVPPHVPFSARGAYRRRYPAMDPQTVLAELAQTPLAGHAPVYEIRGPILWNKIAWETHNKSFSALSPALQEQVKEQVSAIVVAAGWQINDKAPVCLYYRPADADIPRVRMMVEELLKAARGAPVDDYALTAQAQRAAYGRLYYGQSLTGDVKRVAHDLLRHYRYLTRHDEDDLYQPQPVALIEDAATQLANRLAALEPLPTQMGPVTITLRRLGYKAEPEWLAPSAFTPPLAGQGGFDTGEVFLRELRLSDEVKTLQLVKGMRVHTPAVALDSDKDEIVYLEMAGQKAAVRANWAALVGKKAQWIGRQRVYLEGMKNHIHIQTKLPCGWLHTALIHRQGSLQEANPEEPFYLLDDGRQPIPLLFYPMLNRCLAVPLLPAWSDYLWSRGRERELIVLLNNGQGQGYAAWRVLPAPAEWEAIISGGLQAKQIVF